MKLIALTKENSGVDYHRILLPLSYLPITHEDTILQVSNKNRLTKSFFHDKDIVLFSRECPFNLDQILEFRKEFGFKIIVDIDDSWRLNPEHFLYDYWKTRGVGESILKSIQIADLVTTTHEYLKQKIVAWNKNCVVLPNALPYDHQQFTKEKFDLNQIVYSCGITHYNDLRQLTRFFELCRQNADIQKFTFCLAGYSTHGKRDIQIWNKLESLGKSYGNYKRLNSLPLNRYMEHYKQAKICIAPLQDNEFNRCKSNLKILEAGAKELPILASAMHPYTEMPGVFLCKTSRDWYTNLKLLIKNPDLIAEKGKQLGDYVREHYNLININDERFKVYKQLTTQ